VCLCVCIPGHSACRVVRDCLQISVVAVRIILKVGSLERPIHGQLHCVAPYTPSVRHQHAVNVPKIVVVHVARSVAKNCIPFCSTPTHRVAAGDAFETVNIGAHFVTTHLDAVEIVLVVHDGHLHRRR